MREILAGLVMGVLASAALVSAAQPVAETGFAALIHRLERAVVTGDVEELERCDRELEGASEAWGMDGGLRRYTVAYVGWRLGSLLEGNEGVRSLKRAERVLKELVAEEPDNAEAMALLGSVYGDQIKSAWKGMRLGPKASKALDRAEKLLPDDPRVALQQAISAFFTPKRFGGGVEVAEQELRRAEKLFAQEPLAKPWPNWGRVDVYVWSGQVLAKKGDHEGARIAYEKGLTLEPGHAWILNELLPALEDSED